MSNIFFISDTHFQHSKPYTTFLRPDGSPLRPHGSSEAGDLDMITKWNSRVTHSSKIYVLGDVMMGTNDKAFEILYRLNGEKILIKGNHDLAKPHKYLEHFKDIRGSHQFDGMIMTHIPIHPDSLSRWHVNVHGHLHFNEVKGKREKPDPRYLNVSVEQPWMDYAPISYEELKQVVKKRLEEFPQT